MAKDKLAQAFKPGDHASTFGGNPFVTSCGNVVIDELLNGGILDNVKKQGKLLHERLMKLKEKHKCIFEVRGFGLIQGIELIFPAADVISDCIDNGLLLVGAGSNVIRFVPALIVTEKEINEAMEILDEALGKAENK